MSKRRQKKQLRNVLSRRLSRTEAVLHKEYRPTRAEFTAEQLEPRILLAAVLEGTLLKIFDTTTGNDTVHVSFDGGNGQVEISGNLDGGGAQSFVGVDSILIQLGDGNDTASVALDVVDTDGNDMPVTIEGGNGNDTILAGAGNTLLIGDADNDILLAPDGAGNITMRGGTGNDTFGFEDDWGDTVIEETTGTDTISFNGALTGGALQHWGDTPATNNTTFNIGVSSSTLGVVEGTISITHAANLIENLASGDGDDTFSFGAGDSLADGSGNIDGGGGTNTLDFSAYTTDATIDLSNTLENSGAATFGDVNVVQGGSGNDLIRGTTAADSLIGNGGNDTIEGDEGEDTMRGNAGTNTLSFEHSENAVEVDLSEAATTDRVVDDGFGDTDDVDGFDNLIGGDGGDTLTGNANANSIRARGGDNLIDGGAGNDTVVVDDASDEDTVDGGADTNTLDFSNLTSPVTVAPVEGSAGELDATSGGGLLLGAENIQNIVGSSLAGDLMDYTEFSIGVAVNLTTGAATNFTGTISGFENVTGGDVNDTLTGDANANLLIGGPGDDVLVGNAGADTYRYEAAATGNDTVTSGEGDIFDFSEVGTGLTYFANGGSGAGTVVVTGGGTITGVNAADVLNAQAGSTNLLDYTGVGTSVEVDLAEGTATNFTAVSNFNQVTGGDSGDVLDGDGNANTLSGGGGNDTLNGKGGDDVLSGDGGNDSFVFEDGFGQDTVNDSAGTDTMDFSALTENGIEVELGSVDVTFGANTVTHAADNIDVIVGTNQNDTFSFTEDGDDLAGGVGTVDGGLGDDEFSYENYTTAVTATLGGAGTGLGAILNFEVLRGGTGNDTLTGDANPNTLVGGVGNDSISGAAGNDVYLYENGVAFGTDTINDTQADQNTLDMSDLGDAVVFAIGASTLTATQGANVVTDSNKALAVIISGGDDDTFSFANGAEHFDGQSGQLNGGGSEAGDTISYAAYTTAVSVNLSGGEATGVADGAELGIVNIENATGGTGNDTLNGDGFANILDGGAGNDSIFGSGGNDTLLGLAGNDTLDGGDNDDVMLGGANDDTFLFTSNTFGSDDIQEDIGGGDDTMDFAALSTNLAVEIGSVRVDAGGGNVALHDTENNVENLVLGSGDDTVTFEADNDSLAGSLDAGGSENGDTLSYVNKTTNATVDLINGTASDIAGGISGFEHVVGGSGNDTFTGNDSNNNLVGNDGNDTFIFVGNSWGDDTVDAGSDNDTLDFSQTTNSIEVEDPNFGIFVDLTGGDGEAFDGNGNSVFLEEVFRVNDVIGTPLNDLIFGNNRANSLVGGGGDDEIFGGNDDDTILGGEGDNILSGDSGSDSVTSGSGNDEVFVEHDGDGDADVVQDTGGDDTLSFEDSDHGIAFNANLNAGQVQATGGGDSVAVTGDFENLIGSANGDDLTILPGGTVESGGGSDVLNGSGDGDTFTINSSEFNADVTINGAGGDDTVTFEGEDGVEDEWTVNEGDGTVSQDGSTATLNDIEEVVFNGGSGDDTLTINNPTGTGFVNGITFNGGDPTASDEIVVNLNAGGTATIGLDDAQITDVLGGPINLVGVETISIEGVDGSAESVTVNDWGVDSEVNDINIDGGDTNNNDGDTVDVNGTAANDFVEYRPDDPIVEGSSLLTNEIDELNIPEIDIDSFNTAGGSLTLDMGAGDDLVTVIGTSDGGGDAFTIGDGAGGRTRVGLVVDPNDDNDTFVGIDVDTTNAGLIVDADEGDDTIAASQTTVPVTVIGNDGDDLLDYSAAGGPVTVDLSGQDDEESDFQGSASIAGGAGQLITEEIEGAIGGASNDTMTGSSEDDSFVGNGGNDVISGLSGEDTIFGNDGNDSLHGGSGDDEIDGGADNDTLNGGTEDDEEEEGDDDLLTGGSGDDLFVFEPEWDDDVVVEADGGGTDTLDFSAVENDLTITFGSIDVTDGGGNSVDHEGDEIESILGGSGDDTFAMDDDSDVDEPATGGVETKPVSINGGGGLDFIDYSNPAIVNGVLVNLETAVHPGVLAIASIEGVIGSSGNDTITGDGEDNSLVGAGGNDELNGGDGDDSLDGGTGNDTMSGNDGSDTYEFDTVANVGGGNEETDTVNEAEGEGDEDTMDFSRVAGDDSIFADLGDDVIRQQDFGGFIGGFRPEARLINLVDGSEIENVVGGDNGDTLLGDEGDNVLNGGDGDDVIEGGAGNDTLNGNDGDDEIDGGDDNDSITGGDGDDELSGGQGNDTLQGNNDDDFLDGGINDDVLEGGAGDDVLEGGQGDDTLNGNGDSDGESDGDDDDLIGGGDDDTYLFDNGFDDDAIFEELDEGNDTADFSAVTSGITFTVGSLTVVNGGNTVFHEDVNVPSANHVENLIGGSADDVFVFTGGSFPDVLGTQSFSNDGTGSIDGGPGINTLTFAAIDVPVQVNLTNGTATFSDRFLGTRRFVRDGGISNIRDLTGGSAGDVLTGDGQSQLITGNGGNDAISALGGDDTVVGGGGSDAVDGGTGTDQISFAGNPAGSPVVIRIDAGLSSDGIGGLDSYSNIEGVIGTPGDDIIVGGVGVIGYVIDGGLGNDILVGGANSNDEITGGGGSDLIVGLGGDDELTGDGGNDTVIGGAGNDELDGGTDNDTYVFSDGWGIDNVPEEFEAAPTGNQDTFTFAGHGRDVDDEALGILGLTDDFFFFAPADADLNFAIGSITVTDGLGNSVTHEDDDEGRTNVEILEGGLGTDQLDYSAFGDAAVINLGAGTATAGTASGTIAVSGIENVLGSVFNDTITGDGGSNVIDGALGDDVLDGAGGIDTVSFASSPLAVTATLGAPGTATGATSGTDSLSNFENMRGGLGADVLTGDGGANTFFSSPGNDTITGAGGTDTADYSDVAGGITGTVNGTVTGAGIGTDTLVTIENLIGSATGANSITGDGGANVLTGGTGNDTISAGGGNDTVIGTLGNDLLDGGAGNDTIEYPFAETNMTVNLATGLATGLGTDTLVASAGDGNSFENVITGAGSDTITGDSDNNILTAGDGDNSVSGGTGNDVLTTGDGDDFLNGGAGNDTMTGGLGDDFYLETPGSSGVAIDTGGDDTMSFQDATLGVTVNFDLAAGQVQVLDSAGNTLAITGIIENLIGSANNDVLEGTDVTYVPGPGNDRITDNGSGTLDYIDEQDIFETTRGVRGSLPNPGRTSRITDTAGDTDTLVSPEDGGNINDVLLSGGGHSLRGNDLPNFFLLLDGGNNVTLDGRGGDDEIVVFNDGPPGDRLRIRGGNGNDDIDVDGLFDRASIDGGRDNDSIDVDIVGDRNRAQGGQGNDSMDIFNLFGENNRASGGAGDDFISGIFADSGLDIRGDGGNDILNGSPFNDLINGSGGNDRINGMGSFGDGFDDLRGGSGLDTFITGTDASFTVINGNGGRDTLIFDALATDVGVHVDFLRGIFGDADVEGGLLGEIFAGTSRGVENAIGTSLLDVLRGGNGSNFLNGSSGDDVLIGLNGNDTLVGNNGDDSLDGGRGRDHIFGGDTDDDEADEDGDVDGEDSNVFDPTDPVVRSIDDDIAVIPLPFGIFDMPAPTPPIAGATDGGSDGDDDE